MERLIAVMRAKEITFNGKSSKRVFLAHAGDLAKKKAFAILKDLRGRGFLVSESLAKESLAAQLKVADREGIALALILGQKEIYENSIIVRDLVNGLQEAVPLEKLADEIKKRQK